MKQKLNVIRVICAITVLNLIASLTRADPATQHWTTLRQEPQFKQLKPGDKVAFVCIGCKSVSMIPIQSPEQATKLGKDGESVACPNCDLITKVIVRASRKDLYSPPVVTYVNEKGEERAFLATMAESK